uniref:Uncharacterized protein n=1 Tax=Trypanosoma vivax (strain Y486) TaxID=1055687 RepID=G0UAT1_TRYVY|nr:conserved hypothetical protein [Trypanosoma vivax Y486]
MQMDVAKAKRATRGSVKDILPTPYTTSSPFVATRGATTKIMTRLKRTRDMFARTLSTMAQKLLRMGQRPRLEYGDIIRDLPFHTHNRVVSFFSTHQSLCSDIFGVSHGQCLRMMRGPWANELVVVIGVRGGRLWVLSDSGPVVARPIYAVEYLRWEKVAQVPSLEKRLREGLEAAQRDAKLDYDAEQREFLQKAPDLFAEVLDDETEAAVHVTKSNRNSGFSRLYTEDYSPIRDTVGDTSRSTAPRCGATQKRVILVPQVELRTGSPGWAGEGVVLVNGGGVESFCASLSASVLL